MKELTFKIYELKSNKKSKKKGRANCPQPLEESDTYFRIPLFNTRSL